MAFVLDRSGSMQGEEDGVRRFALTLLAQLNLSPTESLAAVITLNNGCPAVAREIGAARNRALRCTAPKPSTAAAALKTSARLPHYAGLPSTPQ